MQKATKFRTPSSFMVMSTTLDQQQQQNPTSSLSRVDRKTVEKNRRNHIKVLYSQLNSLLPRHQHSTEVSSLPDQIDAAVNYIKKLQTNLEEMRANKDRKRGAVYGSGGILRSSPHIEIREMGSALDVVLITGLDFQFKLKGVIRLLLEEGTDIVSASFSVVEDTIFHNIHSMIGECAPGTVAARISERLGKFVNGDRTTSF